MMLPLLHRAQEQNGCLSDEGTTEFAELTETTPTDERSTPSFYNMYHLESVGKHVVGLCTNTACLLIDGEGMLEHANDVLGCAVGATFDCGFFALESRSAWPTATKLRACWSTNAACVRSRPRLSNQ